MRHGVKKAKLQRTASHRKALLANQACSLISHGRITTTLAKAKALRPYVEKLITLGKNGSLHARRQAMAYLYNLPAPRKEDETKKEYAQRARDVKNPVVEKLFREIGPKYKARNAEKNCSGGYTRIYKLGPRRGDAAEMVILELV